MAKTPPSFWPSIAKKTAPTLARMIKLKKNDPCAIVLPNEFIESYGFQNKGIKWAVMILSPHTLTVRIIAVKGSTIVKVTVDYIKKDVYETIHELEGIFIRNNMKTIYTSGFCISEAHKTPCHPFEAYFDPCDSPFDKDQLKSEMSEKPGVVNVEIANIDIKNGAFR